METKPLLFLDVDGPLNPIDGNHGKLQDQGYVMHKMRPRGFEEETGMPALNVLLWPEHGKMLQSLDVELVWGTTWEHEANEWIGPHLGLPQLPVCKFDNKPFGMGRGIHWKTFDLLQYAKGRPFIWIDDEISATDREHVLACHPHPHKLVWVSPLSGLTERHIAAINEWIKEL